MTNDTTHFETRPALDARITSVIRYWDQLRDGRPAPGRVEIRPTAISRHLSRICILERPRAGTVRMRLAGATISARMGMELRGMPFRSLFQLDDRSAAMDAAETAIATPAVSILSLCRQERTGLSAEATMAILPLIDTRGGLTRALAVYSERPAMTPYISDIRGRFTIDNSWTLDIPETGPVLGAMGGLHLSRPIARVVPRVAASGGAAQMAHASEENVRPVFQVIDGGLA